MHGRDVLLEVGEAEVGDLQMLSCLLLMVDGWCGWWLVVVVVSVKVVGVREQTRLGHLT